MAIPIISNSPELAIWRQKLKSSTKKVFTPRIPWNFQVVNKQGGNYLTWQSVDSADGYIVEISTNAGDFSSGTTTVNLKGQSNTAYFDSVPTNGGTTPATRWYRVRATAGTISEPQKVEGLNTGIVSSTAMAPTDTTTVPTTSSDTTTSQTSQSRTGTGNYRQINKVNIV